MTQQPHWAHRIHEILKSVDPAYARVDSLADFAPGSGAAADAAHGEVGILPYVFAVASIQVALDQLRSWRHLHMAGMQPPFAHWSMLRVAVEGATVARWLCEPGQVSRERIARGAGAQLADFEQRLGFESRVQTTMPGVRKPRVSAAKRIEQLRGRAAALGISATTMPGPTQLARDYSPSLYGINSEVLYRLVSAFAHAKMWGMPILNEFGRDDMRTIAPGVAVTEFTASDHQVALVTEWAMRTALLAVADLQGYVGPLEPPSD